MNSQNLLWGHCFYSGQSFLFIQIWVVGEGSQMQAVEMLGESSLLLPVEFSQASD